MQCLIQVQRKKRKNPKKEEVKTTKRPMTKEEVKEYKKLLEMRQVLKDAQFTTLAAHADNFQMPISHGILNEERLKGSDIYEKARELDEKITSFALRDLGLTDINHISEEEGIAVEIYRDYINSNALDYMNSYGKARAYSAAQQKELKKYIQEKYSKDDSYFTEKKQMTVDKGSGGIQTQEYDTISKSFNKILSTIKNITLKKEKIL